MILRLATHSGLHGAPVVTWVLTLVACRSRDPGSDFPDRREFGSDGDRIPDQSEAGNSGLATAALDSDGDGFPNFQDLKVDGTP